MKNLLENKTNTLLIAILLIGGSFFGGYEFALSRHFISDTPPTTLENTAEGTPVGVDFAPFWKVWNVLNDKYVAKKLPADQDRVYGAISGLAASMGDPYTVFFPPEEKKSFDQEISGNFEGVGMEVGIRDKMLTVIAPLKGNPAEKAGVRSGDKIIKIDDKVTTDLKVDEAVKLIRGKKGTEVRLTLVREGKDQPFEIKIIRDTITIPTVDTELRKDGIFVITLHNFSAVASNLFRNGLREFVESGSDKLVLDLRGNPGGYLQAAVEMASWFLPAGKVVVSEDMGRNGIGTTYRSQGFNIFTDKLKFIILVNEGSASASEILAGALAEHGKAKLVGVNTFGKGSVQELVQITPETSLKVTIARWLTPNGNSISEGGLKPDYEVKITPEDIEKKLDPQMDKAVELLLKK